MWTPWSYCCSVLAVLSGNFRGLLAQLSISWCSGWGNHLNHLFSLACANGKMFSFLFVSEVWGNVLFLTYLWDLRKPRLNFPAPWKASSLDCKHFVLWCGYTGFWLYLDLVCEIWLMFPSNIIMSVLIVVILTWWRVKWEEGSSTVKMPPLDWHVGNPLGQFLD